MNPRSTLVSIAMSLLTATAFAGAESPGSALPDANTTNPILAPAAGDRGTATAPTPAARAISPATAARLAALTPKYTPPPPASLTPNPPVDEPEDKPRNGIVRLPSYIVREAKVPALSEVQVLTPKGRVDLAYKAFPGLRFGSFWIFRNDGIALQMLDEELMLERQREIAELTSLLPANQTDSDTRRSRLIRDALAPRSSPPRMMSDRTPGQ